MKVLFINASKKWEGRVYREYPYGVGILATLADQAGYDIHILDMAVDGRDYCGVVEMFQPDVVAVSFFSPSVQIAEEVISAIAAKYEVPVIAGGIHSTLYPYDVLDFGADIVMIGEGELYFVSVLDSIRYMRESLERTLSCIPNLVFRNRDGRAIRTKSTEDSVELDKLPIMNRNLFDLSLYKICG